MTDSYARATGGRGPARALRTGSGMTHRGARSPKPAPLAIGRRKKRVLAALARSPRMANTNVSTPHQSQVYGSMNSIFHTTLRKSDSTRERAQERARVDYAAARRSARRRSHAQRRRRRLGREGRRGHAASPRATLARRSRADAAPARLRDARGAQCRHPASRRSSSALGAPACKRRFPRSSTRPLLPSANPRGSSSRSRTTSKRASSRRSRSRSCCAPCTRTTTSSSAAARARERRRSPTRS